MSQRSPLHSHQNFPPHRFPFMRAGPVCGRQHVCPNPRCDRIVSLTEPTSDSLRSTVWFTHSHAIFSFLHRAFLNRPRPQQQLFALFIGGWVCLCVWQFPFNF